jgi:hypothetical protein
VATIRQDLVSGIEARVIRSVEADREVIGERAVAIVGDGDREARREIGVQRNFNTTEEAEIDRDVVVVTLTRLAFDLTAGVLAFSRHGSLFVGAVGRRQVVAADFIARFRSFVDQSAA